MELEKIVQILIYIHAGFGGVALLTGAVALIVKKGSQPHKQTGKIFYYSMLISTFLSLGIAFVPGHENPFLFSIGVLSSYFLISGYRSLRFRKKGVDLRVDKIIAYLIILTGVGMVFLPMILSRELDVVLFVFGILGLAFGARDLRLFSQTEQLKKKWLKLHLGKMTGGYIASVTAFLVVNDLLSGVYNWFVPSVIGTIFITYWVMKLNKKSPT